MINKVVAINQLHYYLSVGYAAIVECSGQLQPGTFLKEFSNSIGD